MAQYRLHALSVGRDAIRAGARGASPALARCQYILREGRYQDQADPVLRSGSENMPAWAQEQPEAYWAAADAYERDNARLYKYLEVSLPVELNLDAQERALREFLGDSLGPDLPFTFAIHSGYGRNPHAHVMVSERVNDGLARTPEIWFRRANATNPAAGGARKSQRLRPKQWLQDTREQWADAANRGLAEAGERARVDHRSYAARGIDLLPQPKIGRAFDDASGIAHPGVAEPYERLLEVAEDNGRAIASDPTIGFSALTSQQSTFSRSELLAFVSRNSVGEEQYRTVLRALLTSPQLVELGLDARGREHFTTTEVLLQERQLEAAASRLSRGLGFATEVETVARVTAERGLSPEQEAALRHITQAGSLALVEGHAGTGKSYMLGAARTVWEESGYTVVGAAVAGKAAQGLAADSGIASATLHARLRRWAAGTEALSEKHVVVVDEAAMVGTRLLAELAQQVNSAGAKLVLVGDTRQLAAVDAGAPMAFLRRRHGAAVLKDVRRQGVDWQRQLSKQMAAGATRRALEGYDAQGRVVQHDRHDDARAAVVAQWDRDVRQLGLQHSLILAYRRTDVAELNRLARAALIERGALPRCAHRLAGIDVARGERLYFTRNDSALGVQNGSLGTVLSVRGSVLRVRLDEGRVVEFDAAHYRDIQHGYAATVHKAQGVTVRRSVVLACRPMNESATYVALSRHKEDTQLHWAVDEFVPERAVHASHDERAHAAKACMFEALSRVQEKRMALDYLAQPLSADLGEDVRRQLGRYRHADDVQRKRTRTELEQLLHTELTVRDTMARVPQYRLALARWVDAKRQGAGALGARTAAREALVTLSKCPQILEQAQVLVERHTQRQQLAQAALREMQALEQCELRRRELVELVHALHARGVPARTVTARDEHEHLVLEAFRRRGSAQVAVLRQSAKDLRVLMDVTGHRAAASLEAGQLVQVGKRGRWLSSVPLDRLSRDELVLEGARLRQAGTGARAGRGEAGRSGGTSPSAVSEQGGPMSEQNSRRTEAPSAKRSRLEQTEARLAKLDRARKLVDRIDGADPSERLRLARPKDAGTRLLLLHVERHESHSVAHLASPKGETLLFDVSGHDRSLRKLQEGDVVRLGKDGRWLEAMRPNLRAVAEQARGEQQRTALQQRALDMVDRHAALTESLSPRPHTFEDALKEVPTYRAVAEAIERASVAERAARAALARADGQGFEVDRETLKTFARDAAARVDDLSADRDALRSDPAVVGQAKEYLQGLNAQRMKQRQELATLSRQLDRPEREADVVRYLHELNKRHSDRPPAREVAQDDSGTTVRFDGVRKVGERTRLALLTAGDGRRLVKDITHSRWVTKGLEKGQSLELGPAANGKGVYLQHPAASRARDR